MSKTPEELATEYAIDMVLRDKSIRVSNYREEGCMRRGFLAGFELAIGEYGFEALRNKYEAEIKELNTTFAIYFKERAVLLERLAKKEKES